MSKAKSENTKQYCVFFEGLTPELKKSVTHICENASDKSKIYSNFIKDANLIANVLSTDGDLIRSSMISETFKDHFEREINNLKNQKNNLDEILDLYKSSKKWRKNVDNDYFFKRLFRNCIKPDNYDYEIEPNNYDEIESDDDIEQYLGGKSKRNKSKRKKQRTKRKTCRK
jgi:hypothetical protein